jgi:hypothetical protein
VTIVLLAAQEVRRQLSSEMALKFPVAEVSRFDHEVARLLELSYHLAETNRQSMIPSLAGSDTSLVYLRSLLLGALFPSRC